jgi:hypothetical protein
MVEAGLSLMGNVEREGPDLHIQFLLDGLYHYRVISQKIAARNLKIWDLVLRHLGIWYIMWV